MSDSRKAPFPNLDFFNEYTVETTEKNRLPHWRQDGSTYFVTFRLKDSIPANLLADFKIKRNLWIKNHPQPWSPEVEAEYHNQFSSRLDQWMDEGHGSCVLALPTAAAELASCLHHHDGQKYSIHSRVIMPNHVHVLVTLHRGESLSSVVADWKRFGALRINEVIGKTGPLWQKDYFDRIIRDWGHFCNVVRYIRRNPVKAKLGAGSYSLSELEWLEQIE